MDEKWQDLKSKHDHVRTSQWQNSFCAKVSRVGAEAPQKGGISVDVRQASLGRASHNRCDVTDKTLSLLPDTH